MSMRQTKLVTTIGPASENEAVLTQLLQEGADIIRFNTKHNEPEWHRNTILKVQQTAQKMNLPTQVLLDLQGPEVRVVLPSDQPFSLKKGERATFTSDPNPTTAQTVIVPTQVIESLKPQDPILLEDGACEFTVIEKTDHALVAEAHDDCVVNNRKTVNTPGVTLDMPSLLPKDLSFLDALKTEKVDFIGLSYVRTAKDVEILRNELKQRNMSSQIVAKIENQSALDHLTEIIDAADAVMVARGDLGAEIPFFQVPFWQKKIIKECNQRGKFVITATQMLLTMMNNPRPSRAEVSDVANAVYDGTNAVMLSEETAMGKYPVRAVRTQRQIVEYYEEIRQNTTT